MLILTRQPGEKVVIGEDIVLTVLAIDRHGKVRLGVEAPKDVTIVREELLDADDPRRERKEERRD